MDFDDVMNLIGRWGGTLKFFPSDEDARIGIAEQLASMARSEEEIRWLVKRVPELHNQWPGIREVRAVFCGRFRPVDGIEAGSEIYPDGIPSERPQRAALAAGATMALEPGEVSADPEMNALVANLAARKRL